VKTVVSI